MRLVTLGSGILYKVSDADLDKLKSMYDLGEDDSVMYDFVENEGIYVGEIELSIRM